MNAAVQDEMKLLKAVILEEQSEQKELKMREMKDSGIEWIWEIPCKWKVVKLKYIFIHHKIIVGDKVDNYDRLSLTMKGVVKRSKDDVDGLQPEKFETYQILYKNELVFKLIDLQNISTSRVGLSPYTGIVSPAYIIFSSTGDISPDFAEKWFLSMWQRLIFNSLRDDGVRNGLNTGDLLNVKIALPPINEQHYIADFLDRKCELIDKIVAGLEKEIEILKAYKQSLITETVTKGLKPDAEMKDSGVEWIGVIPKSWTVLPLRKIVLEHNSGSWGSGYDEENGTICLRVADFDYENGTFKNTPVTNLTLVALYACKVTPFYINQTTGIQNIALSFFFDHEKIAIPNVLDQARIVDCLNKRCNEVNSIISEKQNQLSILNDYKKTLIYEYVTGKKESDF